MLFGKLSKRSMLKDNMENIDYKECIDFLQNMGYDVSGMGKDKMREATYFSCMRVMQDNISKLPVKMFKKTEDGVEKITKNPTLQKLALRPNPFISASNFWKCVEFQRNHYGNSIVYIDYDNRGLVRGFYPLNFPQVTILIDDGNYLNYAKDTMSDNNTKHVWYIYTDSKGVQHKLRNTEVLHFIGQTTNGITGISIQDYLSTTIGNNQYAQGFINNWFKGGLQINGVVQYQHDIHDNAAARVVSKRFDDMASGIKNAGKVLPLPTGFSFQPITTNMADAQFLDISKYTTKQIMNAFGIKSFMLNDLEKSTYNNITEQQKDFYISTLQSILTMYEQELNYKLLGVDSDFYFKFNVDSILRADLKTRYESYRIGVQGGFISPNEAREKEDLPKVEGGSDIICNGNMQFIKDIGAYYKKDSGGYNINSGGDNVNEEKGD